MRRELRWPATLCAAAPMVRPGGCLVASPPVLAKAVTAAE